MSLFPLHAFPHADVSQLVTGYLDDSSARDNDLCPCVLLTWSVTCVRIRALALVFHRLRLYATKRWKSLFTEGRAGMKFPSCHCHLDRSDTVLRQPRSGWVC